MGGLKAGGRLVVVLSNQLLFLSLIFLRSRLVLLLLLGLRGFGLLLVGALSELDVFLGLIYIRGTLVGVIGIDTILARLG